MLLEVCLFSRFHRYATDYNFIDRIRKVLMDVKLSF